MKLALPIIMVVGMIAICVLFLLLAQKLAWVFNGGFEKEINRSCYYEEVERLETTMTKEHLCLEAVEFLEFQLNELKRLWSHRPEEFTFEEHHRVRRRRFPGF